MKTKLTPLSQEFLGEVERNIYMTISHIYMTINLFKNERGINK